MYKTKSENITEGLRKSFQSTDCKMANRICYGYITAADGELAINEMEAKVVRFIFECYLSGDSLGKISTALEKQGIDDYIYFYSFERYQLKYRLTPFQKRSQTA